MGDITLLIARARGGDRAAFDSLFAALYPELRRIAHRRLARNSRDGMLDTTVLVHECYLKFAGMDALNAIDRAHFLAYSATVMRSIIVNLAEARRSAKRGGDALHVTLNTMAAESVAQPEEEILDVHAALGELERVDARLVQVVEMRYFGGMKEADIADILGLTERTVRRDWEKARLFLAQALRA